MEEQLTTFIIGREVFGIEVNQVQEVTGKMKFHPVPKSPRYIRGLINLRGQIATAISLKRVFNIETEDKIDEMSIVCRIEGNLLSFIVDTIGDVLTMQTTDFEATPLTINEDIRKFVKGVYKMQGQIISVLDIDFLYKELIEVNESPILKKTVV